ncbi:12341_t:CDS:2, partial [Gigaspora rosea]
MKNGIGERSSRLECGPEIEKRRALRVISLWVRPNKRIPERCRGFKKINKPYKKKHCPMLLRIRAQLVKILS